MRLARVAAVVVAVPVVVVALVRPRPTGADAQPAGADAQPAAPDPRLLDELSLLATGHLVTAAARDRYATGGIDGFVDALLDDPAFAKSVGPDVVVGSALRAPSSASFSMVVVGTIPGAQARFALGEPCPAAAAARVRPWWAPDTEALVCPSAYRPDRLFDPAHPDWRCSGANLSHEHSQLCGCGPSLMFCLGGTLTEDQVATSLRNEVRDTVAHVVAHDQPLAGVYTMNETVRDGTADFFYQRGRLLAGEIDRLPDPRAAAGNSGLRRRPESWPGQQAGILTTYHLLYISDGTRDRLRDYYALMWCEDSQSQDVATEQILGLGVTDLRDGAGWQKLAAMPVCTRCHARLDYGMQFFLGQPSSYVAHYHLAAQHRAGRGPLYGRDIDDPRGDAPLTARGFAVRAVAQPEFAACMVKRVTDHVFDYRASPADRQVVAEALRTRKTLRAMMRAALLRHATAGSAAPPAAAPLRAMVDEHCLECHDEAPRDFRGALPPDVLGAMLPRVAFRSMPKGNGMEPAERRRLVGELIDAVYPGAAARDAAGWYYLRSRALPVHRPDALWNVLSATTGTATQPATRPIETQIPSDRNQLTPGLAAELMLDALQACRAQGHAGAALEACLERAAPPSLIGKTAAP